MAKRAVNRPGLVMGTSSEYLGQRPLRRTIVERPVALVVGPRGSGKTVVAARIAACDGAEVLHLSHEQVERTLAEAVGAGEIWPAAVRHAPALVLDDVAYLEVRQTLARLLLALIRERVAAGLRTVVCMNSDDHTSNVLMDGVATGQLVNVVLRFPVSRAARLRFARRACDRCGSPRSAAHGTDLIVPWRYDTVIAAITSAGAA